MNNLTEIKKALRQEVRTSSANSTAASFFKTSPGSYAEHDQFIGVSVPHVRAVAKQYDDAPLEVVHALLESPINEERLLALVILTTRYKKADTEHKGLLYQFYLDNIHHVNNWNLVDSSAHLIVGEHLKDKDKQQLLDFAVSPVMWERRIAIVATWAFIKKNDVAWTFILAKILLHDTHDLIHKAVGWMMREAGKKNQQALVDFLEDNARSMPRTMLRYAIEKFPEEQRKRYLLLK